MHKFTSEYGEGYQPEKIEITVSRDASLTEMVESFTYYLKACGYHIPEGEALDFVPEDGYSSEGWDNMGTVTEDFDPRGGMGDIGEPVFEKGYPSYDAVNSRGSSIDDATPEDWNNAYRSVTVTSNGIKLSDK